MRRAVQRYRLGCSRDGGVIFWQIDPLEQIYDGKIMYYRQDCHRDKARHPQWVNNLLKRHYLRKDDPLMHQIPTCHCLFGWHLLNEQPQCTVAVVEAEKTAVVMSEVFPEYLWMASGGLSELTATKLFPLRGRRVILFPDTDPDRVAYSRWRQVARKAENLMGQPVTVSALLEQRATKEQKQAKIDLVDFLFQTEEQILKT